MLARVKESIPWWGKIAAKLLLARIPMSYVAWQRIGVFRHGYMDTAEYALSVFDAHVANAGLKGRLLGKTLLELGPGDSIATAIIAYAYGARAILVDAGSYARGDLGPYKALAELLRSRGLSPPDLSAVRTLEDVLSASGARYLTAGIESWRSVSSESVDFVFSQAVLEHVRRHEFLVTQKECYRVMRPRAVASHRVDLRDHLSGGLNNLRFSERLWESAFFVSSGFYTNRIQYSEMLRLMREAGFGVVPGDVRRWPDLPTPRRSLSEQFRGLPKQELQVSGFDVVLHR